MKELQGFQRAAREGGFVEVQERGEGTVLWLAKEKQDSDATPDQRICIDSLLKSVTIYWVNASGKTDAKSFRTVPGLQEWFALHPAR
jgi:hypothetical protein